MAGLPDSVLLMGLFDASITWRTVKQAQRLCPRTRQCRASRPMHRTLGFWNPVTGRVDLDAFNIKQK